MKTQVLFQALLSVCLLIATTCYGQTGYKLEDLKVEKTGYDLQGTLRVSQSYDKQTKMLALKMKNEYKILIIEDDMLLNDMTKRLLTQHGYCATSAYSGSEALLLIEKGTFDLILLDLMLPGIPGETVLEKMKSTMDIPIIGVSAKTDIDSKVNLIRNGADDYITKPFDNQELLVRIEAVLRRFQKSTTPNNSKILRFKDLSLDTEAMEAKIRNTPITLTRYEYLILQLLMSSPSKVFTKNNIFESVWNENFIGDDNAINVHIGNLRKKFAKVNPEEKYIQTVWGLGFKMQG
mgnify:CR=1 FL=1